jgi:hypothetical protein
MYSVQLGIVFAKDVKAMILAAFSGHCEYAM